jgi:hypothetical protein
MMYRDNADVIAMLPVKVDSVAGSGGQSSASGFKVRPTPLGLQSPALQLGDSPSETEQIWSKLASLYWMLPIGELKPGGQVKVVFTLPGQVDFFTFDSEVCWYDDKGRAGLRSLNIPPEQHSALQNWLSIKLEEDLPESVARQFRNE